MAAYRNAILEISARFEGLKFHHITQESNQEADILTRMGAKCNPVPPNTSVERLFRPSVVWQGESKEGSTDMITPPAAEHNANTIGGPYIEITPSSHEIMAVIAPWTKPFLAYLNRQELPNDQNEARCMRVNYTKRALPEYSKGVSLKRREGNSW